MKIEFWFCREYFKKVNAYEYWNNTTPLFTITDSSIVKESVGDTTQNTVVDNDFFVQDCGEWSCSVKFSQALFDILFTKKAHPYFKKLSMYVIRVFDDSDNNIFDGAIKSSGSTISADKKTISFSAYDWLIFVNEIKPAETEDFVNLDLLPYLHKYITGHYYDSYNSFNGGLGVTYFKINEDGTQWNTMNILEPFKLIDDGVSPEPLAEFQTKDYIMTDNGVSFNCQLDDRWNVLSLAVGGFTKDANALYYHVLVGYSAASQCEYWKFKCWNVVEFEPVPDLFAQTDSIVIGFSYNSIAMLKTKLNTIVSENENGAVPQKSISFNNAIYSITGNDDLVGVLFDRDGSGIIIPGSFKLAITISGVPVLTTLKTQNKDLLAKALFIENRGLSVLGYTFSIKKKSDFIDISDYTVIPKSKGVEWNLSTIEPEPFDLDIFDSIPGYNKIGTVTCLEYWLKQRVEKFIKGVTTTLECTTSQPLNLADVIVLEDMPKPIKFRISEISYNPLRPQVKNVTAYNISDGSIFISQPGILKSGSTILMNAQPGTVIYYTYNNSTTPPDPTGANNQYTTPLNLLYGNYKAIAKVGTLYSAITSFTAAPDMLNNVIIHYYLNAYVFGRDQQDNYFMNMYIFKEEGERADNVACVIFNMDFEGFPYKHGIKRYSFSGNRLIESSSEYMELRADQIGSHLSASHLEHISNFLALAGYTGEYNDYTLNTLTFTDNAGLKRSYTVAGWTVEEPYMRYSGLKTF